MKPVIVIGMGQSPEDLTRKHQELIQKADLLIGGQRHLSHFNAVQAEKAAITADLAKLMTRIKSCMHTQQVVVLASGDPLFYGIGRRLVDQLGAENVVFYPNVSSVAAAFARLKLPWQNTPVVSLHGRPSETELYRVLQRSDQVAVLTDPVHNPAWLAKWVQRQRLGFLDMCVFEQLGAPTERYGWLSPVDAAKGQFAEPNLVILKRRRRSPADPCPLHLGMPESGFAHQRGLITKAEVRAVTLSKLQLQSHHTLWDLGAGSGSVAIEAGLFLKSGRIYAVEKQAERIEHINENIRRYGLDCITAIQAVLPDGLGDLPQPDRIFVGGGGQTLIPVIKAAAARLAQDGLMVVNTVLVSSLQHALAVFQELNWRTEVVQVQIHRSTPMPYDVRLEAENPVWVISAEPATTSSE